MKIRVYYEDVDIGGIVYHAKYLHFCERARSELFFQAGKSPVYDGYHFVVKDLQANFLKPAFFGDILEVHTKLLEQERVRLHLRQEIYREKERIFSMDLTLVCLKGQKPAQIPPYFLEALQALES